MTLSMAWIRKAGNVEELIFATDSRLSGGQDWDCCPKIMRLPRGDCAICFAGETDDAYPPMLQIKAAIEMFPKALDRSLDLYDLKGHIIRVLNGMRTHISNLPVGWTKSIEPQAMFIFGGYSWKRRKYALWLIYYDAHLKKFTFRPAPTWRDSERVKKIVFAGDYVSEAKKMLVDLLRTRKKLTTGGFDMEPLEILCEVIRCTMNKDIGGPPQMVKVYQSLTSVTFGIMWDVGGTRTVTLGGRPLLNYETTTLPILDPDTLQVTSLYAQSGKT